MVENKQDTGSAITQLLSTVVKTAMGIRVIPDNATCLDVQVRLAGTVISLYIHSCVLHLVDVMVMVIHLKGLYHAIFCYSSLYHFL